MVTVLPVIGGAVKKQRVSQIMESASWAALSEKLLIDLLDVHSLLDSAPYIVAHHKLGKLLAVDGHKAFAEKLRCLTC
jgi:hypothetical protein